MMKSTHTIAVVRRRINGNDPMGCGFGAGRASVNFKVSCKIRAVQSCIENLTSGEKWRRHFVSGIVDAWISV